MKKSLFASLFNKNLKGEKTAMKFFSKLIIILAVLMLILVAGCSNDEKAMVNAVRNGDTAKVQSLLDKGVSPDLKTDDGKTILMLAAYLGHTDIAGLLIDKGADVNAKDGDGKTALMYAAETGNIEMAKLLLEKGADINATDNNGKTALQIAQDNNQTEMVEFLSNWGKSAPTPEPTLAPTSTPIPESDATPTPVPEPAATPEPTVANQQLYSIFFDFDKTALRSDQIATMEKNLAVLQNNPEMYIILGGHADEEGTREYNQVLSEQRVETIRKYLVDNGIDPEQIIAYAYGEDYPLEEGHDEDSRSYNRRGDILMCNTQLSSDDVLDETID